LGLPRWEGGVRTAASDTALFTAWLPRHASTAAAVDCNDLERGWFDALETADIDGGHGLAVRPRAEAERRAAAGRAEVMLDDVLVDQVVTAWIALNNLHYFCIFLHACCPAHSCRVQAGSSRPDFSDLRKRSDCDTNCAHCLSPT